MSFSWYGVIDDETFDIKHDTLVEYINKYGVNAVDASGNEIYGFFTIMSKKEIKFVISIDEFDFRTPEGYLYYPGFYMNQALDITVYILKLLLRKDHDGSYITEKIKSRFSGVYDSLLEYLLSRKEFWKDHYSDRLDVNASYYVNLCKQIDMLLNHKNRKTTLFNMMLPWLDKSDKRARFQ